MTLSELSNGRLEIVMYHYVRPLNHENFSRLRFLDLDRFRYQLDYLCLNRNIIPTDLVIDCVLGRKPLPKNACWLTFDDGYTDHYQYVFPELKKRGLSAAFFPAANSILKHELIDATAIQHILAMCDYKKHLRLEIDQLAIERGVTPAAIERLRALHLQSNRFDSAEVIYIKRALQHALPYNVRKEIIDILFNTHVQMDPASLAKRIYMSKSQLQEMMNSGMYIGSHGTEHCWLDQKTYREQYADILESLYFLEELGGKTKNWVMCYPFGTFNTDTLAIVSSLGAAAGIITEPRIADLNRDNRLTLPRVDTNDLPQAMP